MRRLRIRIIKVYGVFPVSCVVEMEISLNNPGFQVDVSKVEIHQVDVPKSSLGSSSLGEATRRSCVKCHGRMSSFSLGRHLFCIKCRGSEYNVDSRCDECFSWTKEEMEGYVRLSLFHLRVRRVSPLLDLPLLLLGPLTL